MNKFWQLKSPPALHGVLVGRLDMVVVTTKLDGDYI